MGSIHDNKLNITAAMETDMELINTTIVTETNVLTLATDYLMYKIGINFLVIHVN